VSEKKSLNDFYEKLYFHEIDAREKLYARVTVPLAVLVSIVGALVFMLQNLRRDVDGGIIFYCFFAIATVFIFIAAYYLKSATSGDKYEFIAGADSWDAYRKSCESTYDGFDDAENLIHDAVRESICVEQIRCASVNAAVNDKRSNCLFLTIKYLIISAIFVLLAFIAFYFGGLDKTSHLKPTRVILEQPVLLKEPLMSTKVPTPQAPPPPPSRVVHEDKHPPTSKKEEKKNG
jgi:uncharacterized membrane protein